MSARAINDGDVAVIVRQGDAPSLEIRGVVRNVHEACRFIDLLRVNAEQLFDAQITLGTSEEGTDP